MGVTKGERKPQKKGVNADFVEATFETVDTWFQEDSVTTNLRASFSCDCVKNVFV